MKPALASLLLLLCIPSVFAQDKDTDNRFVFIPYLWGLNIEGQLEAGPIGADLDLPATELFPHLNFATMGYLQWSRGHQFVYIDGLKVRYHDGHLEQLFDQTVDVDLTMAEIGYGRHLVLKTADKAYKERVVSPFVGYRYIDLKTDVSGDFQYAISEQWAEPVIGIIGKTYLGRNFSLLLKADVAGFTGGFDSYHNELAAIRYHFNEKVSVGVGYRIAKGQYSGAGGFGIDATLKGVLIGLQFDW